MNRPNSSPSPGELPTMTGEETAAVLGVAAEFLGEACKAITATPPDKLHFLHEGFSAEDTEDVETELLGAHITRRFSTDVDACQYFPLKPDPVETLQEFARNNVYFPVTHAKIIGRIMPFLCIRGYCPDTEEEAGMLYDRLETRPDGTYIPSLYTLEEDGYRINLNLEERPSPKFASAGWAQLG